jgi:hypothetical protein
MRKPIDSLPNTQDTATTRAAITAHSAQSTSSPHRALPRAATRL